MTDTTQTDAMQQWAAEAAAHPNQRRGEPAPAGESERPWHAYPRLAVMLLVQRYGPLVVLESLTDEAHAGAGSDDLWALLDAARAEARREEVRRDGMRED